MRTLASALILLLVLCPAVVRRSYSQGNRPPINQQDSLALVALYHAAGGPDWSCQATYCPGSRCWLGDGTWARNWFGVFLEGDLSDRLEAIKLPRNNMVGYLPDEIGDLDAMVRLDLSGNELEGQIPSTISNLVSLEVLQLGSNQISEIPETLYQMSWLKTLDLSSNLLTGTLPTHLVDLFKLEVLNLSRNAFEGEIPELFSKFEKLKALYLAENHLSGKIPESLVKLGELEIMDLANNELEGKLSELHGLFPPKLITLNLQNNRFSGGINEFGIGPYFPDARGGFPEDLERLDLSGNDLTGLIPSWLARLYEVRLHDNRFFKIQTLDLDYNPAAALQYLTVFFNEFDFDQIDIGWSWMRPDYYDWYVYGPQSELPGLSRYRIALEGETLTYHDDVMRRPGSTTRIEHQWLRNGVPIEDASDSSLDVGPVSSTDHGANFAVQATSPKVEGLTLQSTPSQLLVLQSRILQTGHVVVNDVSSNCTIIRRTERTYVPLRKGDVLFPGDIIAMDPVSQKCEPLEITAAVLGTMAVGNPKKLTRFSVSELMRAQNIITGISGVLEAGTVSIHESDKKSEKGFFEQTGFMIRTGNVRAVSAGATVSVSSDSASGTTTVLVSGGSVAVAFDTLGVGGAAKHHATVSDSVVLSDWQRVTVTTDGIQPVESFSISGLMIVPDTVRLSTKGEWRFRATGRLDDDTEVAVPAEWTATGGTIDGDGFFLPDGAPGVYEVTAIEPASGQRASAAVIIQAPLSTRNEQTPELGRFEIGPSHPNPFRAKTTIPFEIGRSGLVRITAFDLLGRTVAVLFDREVAAGKHEAVWDGRSGGASPVAAGIYVISLESPEGFGTAKVVRLADRSNVMK